MLEVRRVKTGRRVQTWTWRMYQDDKPLRYKGMMIDSDTYYGAWTKAEYLGVINKNEKGGLKMASKATTRGANIGTARVIQTYFRPEINSIGQKRFEEILEENKGTVKKLSLNMWLIGRDKNRHSPGYITKLVVRKLGKFFRVDIPTDKAGKVSQIDMATRLLDVEDGDRAGHMRNVFIDCSVDALQVSDETNLNKVYYWMMYPNETDVKYIDDSHTKIVEILKSGKNGTGRSSRILITGGTAEQRDKIAKSLSDNFTVREKYLINNCLIEIVSSNKSFAGCFSGSSDSQGKPIGTPIIQITSHHTDEADVVVHEAIHALREFDINRDTRLRAVKHYHGKDADLEESLTEAETTGRETPFKRGDNYKAGYYHYIKIPNLVSKEVEATYDAFSKLTRYTVLAKSGIKPEGNTDKKWDQFDEHDKAKIKSWLIKNNTFVTSSNKNEEQMVVEDRVTITGERSKSQKGRRVQKSLMLRYPLTNIAHLKLKGTAEAIDTFYEVDNRKQGIDPGQNTKTKIHMYTPDANANTDKIQDQALKAGTDARIIEYHDEKPTVVQAGSKDPKLEKAISEAQHEHKYGSDAFIRSRLERQGLIKYYDQVMAAIKTDEAARGSRDPKFSAKAPRNFKPGGNGHKPKKSNKVGKYFYRGGRVSKHRC